MKRPSLCVIWLDHEHAKLFHFSEEHMERETVRATRVDHHTHRLDGDEKNHPVMYDEIAAKLEQASRILILGPGLAKTHFQNRLLEKHPAIAKKVVGCETSDHPTDHQIAAYAMKYFQKPVA